MKNIILSFSIVLALFFFNYCNQSSNKISEKKGIVTTPEIEYKIDSLIEIMTLEEKIGQMSQRNGGNGHDSGIQAGLVGSILNVVEVDKINALQKIAVEESRLGIPILFARDVIHGFKTIMPIPLGQAATWNPELVKEGAHVAAIESRSVGITWTFTPMIDVSRDPRWGRIAESFGEDHYLTGVLGAAMVKGFQGNDLSDKNSIAACAKHYVAYGAAEAGRDYHTVAIPENDLRDIYLPPFKACVDAGVATIMSAFNEINGVPASGNELTIKQILKNDWGFNGFVVSDWSSVQEMVVHGYAENSKDAAQKGIHAGIDMEMVSTTYMDHVEELLNEKKISMVLIDDAVRRILRIKFLLGLFDNPYTNPNDYPPVLNDDHRSVAEEMARQSIVMLKNSKGTLPLKKSLKKVAVIGPLADAPHEQLGTWIFDGHKKDAVSPLVGIQDVLGKEKVLFAKGLAYSRVMNTKDFPEAIKATKRSDVVVLFLGEESILSGEAHSRADISLPGLQEKLVKEIAKTGKPIIGVIMAGRPLTFENILDKFDALLYAWHPGTMGGPAIADILFGKESPSGKLPLTFPRVVGQIPVYYNQKNSGRPTNDDGVIDINKIPVEAVQHSLGNTNLYLDYGFRPLYPFGYGLSYTTFEYSALKLSSDSLKLGESVEISVNVKNKGKFEADEIVQLYTRDLVGSRTRPVKELKGFSRIRLKPGEEVTLIFKLHTSDLAFHDQNMELVTEPGKFNVWVGGSSEAELMESFEIIR